VNEDNKRFEQAATAVAALLVAFAGFTLWRSGKAPPLPHAREVRVAWRCADGDGGGACSVVSDLERCTTCHDPSAHDKRAVLIDAHASIGCVACHGGDGYALEKKSAHDGKGDEQARCAACHAETSAARVSPAKAAWARLSSTPEPAATHDTTDYAPDLTNGRALYRLLRCGACHLPKNAEDVAPPATPLDVLAARSTPAELLAALEKHAPTDLALDAAARSAVVQQLVAIESAEASTSLPHRASVPGSSADEGKILFDKLACAACHKALHVDVSAIDQRRTPDWIAWYLANPARANPSSRMPSLRLSAREAASLAQHLVRTKPAIEAPLSGRHDGEAIVASGKCAACHAAKLAPERSIDATKPLVDHAGYHFDDATKRALATYVKSLHAPRVRPDLRVPSRPGEEAFASLGCAGCHALDDPNEKRAGPSLFGEGLRVQPQWLFELLRAPQRHPVRPPFHPEWAYCELVPADHATPRMPTFALTESEATALVRFFVDRDGASYPYAAAAQPQLAGDALTTAIADVTHKDRGACLGCHTIAPPDVARARESEGKLAPPLSLAHDRLRASWIEACILQPSSWVMGMPALERPRDEVSHVRDLVLLLRERSVLPPAGAEGQVPALGLGDLY
jgi:cytochrome c2